MKVVDCIQGSEEWYKARCGIPTSSNFDKILTVAGDISKQRDKYLYQLAGERITKTSEEPYQNAVMERGKIMEEEARKFYELVKGSKIKQVGLCVTEGKVIYGASPDGLVGKEGLIEIKCPIISTQVAYLLKGTLPMDYWQQLQGELLVTGRKWVDFISYYPGLRPLVIRVKPHNQFIATLKTELEHFCEELETTVKKIR